MKKFILGLLSGMVLSACSAAYASDAVQALLFPLRIDVNGEAQRLDDEYRVLNYNGHVYLPARFTVESMGGHVYYEEETRRLSIVDERLVPPQDLLATAKVLMEYTKHGELNQAEQLIDSFRGEQLDRLFLSVGRHLFLYGQESDMTGLLQLFIDKRVDLDVQDERGSTPLTILSVQSPKYIPLLIEAGADVNKRDADGSTPLISIANRGMTDLVKLLLDHGANPNAKAYNGYSPLKAAVFPLFANYRIETADTTAMLLAAGADVNVRDDEQQTPLITASQYLPVSKQVVQLLYESGADVRAKDSRQKTALHYIARKGDAEIVGKLLALGAPANDPDQDGNTPLFFAIEGIDNMSPDTYEDKLQIVRLLLNSGANPGAINSQSTSPLEQAAKLNDEELRKQVLELLLGADSRISR
ncbi:ankyrin repeat domain-containing protein [Paenibacillus thalictri]|uniref:Uncharacterized protein n=1 Tax=Paenibacillus thalictri TaxID=2527873 RepID=A0A4Q9DGA5_9BACL|nr:ankyrin repeat domain-containing protein [Paenibacillus thalictri]TBL71240.1 hypothetical protein EYB31_31205 [Paenibacillus thalictri]